MSYAIISPETQILSRSHIISLLDDKGVPWRQWKHTPGCRTLDDMCKYHRDDQFYFRNGDSKEFVIDVHVVVVHIYYHHPKKGWQELFEEKQVFPNGHILPRGNDFDGLGETRRRGLHTSVCARRCLEEEVQFRDPHKYTLSECLETQNMDPRPSEKWPGVVAVYHRYIHECIISKDIHNPDGYVETEEDGRVIYFKWRPRRQRQLAL